MTDQKNPQEWEIFKKLVAPKGHSVTICHDSAVECIGDWTHWKMMRFSGDTLLESLEMAQRASRASQ